MQELWSSASYAPHILSLPFAFAPVAMLVVITYCLVMRGEPVLRAWLLLHFAALLPYSLTMALSPSTMSPAVAEPLFRVAASFIMLAAAAGAGFQVRLAGKTGRTRWIPRAGLALAAVWLVVGALTDGVVSGVGWLAAGFWYPDAGPWAWLAVLFTLAVSIPGFVVLTRAALTEKPSLERRQLRLVLAANVITYSGLVDVALAYHIGFFPVGWLLSGIGSVLVVRALVVEDLLRVRAIDTTLPRVVMHFAVALPLGWAVLRLLGGELPWWLATIVLALAYASVRVSMAIVGLINRGARGNVGTLDRLVGQLVSRARPLESEPAVAQLASDIIELGLGVRVDILLAAAEDYGWTTHTGAKLADDAAPDPLLGGWLAEHDTVVFKGELDRVPEDLRAHLLGLFERNASRALVPIASHDELLALVFVPTDARRMGGRELAFLERACERLGDAIVHARMAQRAASRAALAREIELAATVQRQLLPAKGPQRHGDITIVGSWTPATRCAGDFWGVYPLGDRRVLVAIGDVSGHGVASATVTAAAAAAVDVSVRRYGRTLELADLITALDAAVRRVGGGQLSMTCFCAILDPDAGEIRFISCGHTTPYLVRPTDTKEVELQALVGRGNPLGGGGTLAPKVLQKPLRAGDLVVWYTDGVIEAADPSGEPFGDRRLQRMLRRLDRAAMTPPAVHDLVHAGVAAHRAGQPRGDDETLVVAQWLASEGGR